MTYTVLEQFLSYVVQNNIYLSFMEKQFLLNTPDDIELEDLINWFNSDIRRSERALCMFSSVEINKEQFRQLLTLNKNDIRDVLNYRVNDNDEDLAFSLIATAILKETSKKDKSMNSKEKKELNRKIIRKLLNSSDRDARLDIVSSLPVYSNQKVRNKVLSEYFISENQLLSMEHLLEYYKDLPSDIIGRYVEYILASSDYELDKGTFEPLVPEESIKRLETMERAKKAIISQDNASCANQVMHASLLRGIYQNKELFELIISLPTPMQMHNVIYLCQYNRYRKDMDFVRSFSELDVLEQKRILKDIRDKEIAQMDKEREYRIARQNKKQENLNKVLDTFVSEEGMLSQIRAFRALRETEDKNGLTTRKLIKRKGNNRS